MKIEQVRRYIELVKLRTDFSENWQHETRVQIEYAVADIHRLLTDIRAGFKAIEPRDLN